MQAKNQVRTTSYNLRCLALGASALLFGGCMNPQSGFYNPFGVNELGVPYDSMPPPGLCRVWYPNRPANHQPPAGDCEYLAARLPSDAKLIRGGATPGSAGSLSSPPISQTSLPTSNYPSGGSYPNGGGSPNGGGYSNGGGYPNDPNGAPVGGYNTPNDTRSRQQEDLDRRY